MQVHPLEPKADIGAAHITQQYCHGYLRLRQFVLLMDNLYWRWSRWVFCGLIFVDCRWLLYRLSGEGFRTEVA